MRVMVIVKASKESEAGEMPSTKMLSEMGAFNEQLVKDGVMLAGDGLHRRLPIGGQGEFNRPGFVAHVSCSPRGATRRARL